MEKLGHLISAEVENNNWKPFRLNKNGTKISHLFFADDLLLFSEASMEQAAIIKDTLENFCAVSGARVNKQKSRIFFSPNVNQVKVRDICDFMGFLPTQDLGKYLGVPIHHKRVSKNTYQYILDKMDTRLSNWKASTLSLAGRHTLVSATLSTIPFYAMQSTLLPPSTCEAIDKKCRTFLWGGSSSKKKIHHVSWDNVCNRKEVGGLNLKMAKTQNKAFLTKLGWGLVYKPQALWTQLLREKYKCGDKGAPIISKKGAESRAWKGIRENWEHVLDGVRWTIGNGRDVLFWEDIWCTEPGPLKLEAQRELTEEDKQRTVSHFLNPDGSWKINVMQDILPEKVINSILLTQVDMQSKDRPFWRHTSSGEFSMKSAYRIIRGMDVAQDTRLWNMIWNLPVPQRCRSFLWLVAHDRLLTNVRRRHLLLSTSDLCPRCVSEKEDIMHLLRDCRQARTVWDRLSPFTNSSPFHSNRQSQNWLAWNLRRKEEVLGIRWDILFALVCKQLWAARNKYVFDQCSTDPVVVIAQAVAVAKWGSSQVNITTGNARSHQIWMPPPVGCAKLNTDGAAARDDKNSGCGGLLRDSRGSFAGGFMMNLGPGGAFMAEEWGLLLGLKMAWERGYTNLMIESDCLELVQQVNMALHSTSTTRGRLQEIIHLLRRNWSVKLSWCNRENNLAADVLAKRSLDLVPGLFEFNSVPDFISDVILHETPAVN